MKTQYVNGQCFIINKVNRRKSWLEPTQSAKDHVTDCDQEKCKVQTTKCNWEIYECKNEQLALANLFARVKFKIWISLSVRKTNAIQHK